MRISLTQEQAKNCCKKKLNGLNIKFSTINQNEKINEKLRELIIPLDIDNDIAVELDQIGLENICGLIKKHLAEL